MKIFKNNKMFFFLDSNNFFFGGNYGVSYYKSNINSLLIKNNNNNKTLYFDLKQNLKFFKNLLLRKFKVLQFGCFLEILIVGIGYKCWRLPNNDLLFNLGYSHFIKYYNKWNIFFRLTRYSIKCFSIDTEKLGLMVAELLSLRAPDVYKGKGLRLNTTIIKLKVGKQR